MGIKEVSRASGFAQQHHGGTRQAGDCLVTFMRILRWETRVNLACVGSVSCYLMTSMMRKVRHLLREISCHTQLRSSQFFGVSFEVILTTITRKRIFHFPPSSLAKCLPVFFRAKPSIFGAKCHLNVTSRDVGRIWMTSTLP
jgi:hypothetical protein